MKKSIILLLLIISFASTLFAQSLQNNEFYLKSLEYQKLSEEAFDNGEYAASQENAIEAQKYAALSRQYIADMLLLYRARSSLTAARARMKLADQINLKSSDPTLYDEASTYFANAENKFENEDYENSWIDARRVIELLADIDPQFVSRPSEASSNATTTTYAATYTVKLNLENRDCLWNIAGFSFIYGDPTQWRRIYDANKETFPDPENPNLILPGMVLTIPAIKGEARSGTR